MSKKLFQCGLVGFFLFALLAPSDARGRKPEDDDADNFPDYNRLEMRPKKNAHADETRALDTPPPSKPPLNAPADFPPEDETPKPPPAAVPLPDGASEPPMPDDMLGTLVPSTTNQ